MIYKSYAKVNLSLYITGRDESGYHMLDSVMTAVDIYDRVEIKFRKDNIVTLQAPGLNIPIEQNTAYRAAQLFAKDFGGADISIHKSIPLAAGLGGSSANAATVMRAYSQNFNIDQNQEFYHKARVLGSDIPFMIKGGMARARGRGERLDPFTPSTKLHLVIVKDNYGISTAQCFDKFRELSDTSCACTAPLRNLLLISKLSNNNLVDLSDLLHNDLEKAAITLQPRLLSVRERIISTNPIACTMSGSGSSYVGVYADKASALFAQSQLTHDFPYVIYTTTL